MATTGLFPAASAYFQSGIPDYFPGQTVAGTNQLQGAANQGMIKNAKIAARQGRLLSGQIVKGLRQGPQLNPYVQQVVGDYQNLMNQQFAENQLPALRGSAVSAGGLGGSRQALTEALASQRLNQTMGEQTGNLLKSGWDTAQQNYQNLLRMAPSGLGYSQQAGLLPGTIKSAYGAQQQAIQQARLNAEQDRWNYYRDAGANRLNQYQSNLAPARGYSTENMSGTKYQPRGSNYPAAAM
jgi:hypothetical protein